MLLGTGVGILGLLLALAVAGLGIVQGYRTRARGRR